MATWPAEVRALAPRLYGVGIPARRLFGPWLFWDVVPSLQLAGALSTRAFRALTTRTIRTAGGNASNFGTHSVRRAAAGALVHAGVPRSLVTQALRPASARSDESYILESAKLTAVAAAPRMPPSGRTAGAAAKPGGRLDELAGPLAEGLGLRPAGAPQHGSPMGARMAGGVAQVEGVRAAGGRLPPPPLVGSASGAAANGRAARGYVLPHVRIAVGHGPVRNVDVADRALPAAFQAACAALAAIISPARGRAATRGTGP